jgi:hypothetical protein
MTNKQTNFLKGFHDSLLNSQENKLMTGEKYKNGKQTLDAHDLNQDQWIELVSMNDYPQLWQDASSFLEKQ